MKNTAVLFALVLIISLFQSCKNGWPFCPDKESRDYLISNNAGYIQVDADNLNINMRQAPVSHLQVKGSSNTLASLDVVSKNNCLKFSYSACSSVHKPMDVFLDTQKFDSVIVKNNSKFNLLDYNEDRLCVAVEGAEFEMKNFSGSYIKVNASKKGKVLLKSDKNISDVNMIVNSDGNILAANLNGNTFNIRIDGSGTCSVGNATTIVLYGDGPGTLYYKGSPEIINKTSGLVSLIKAADE